MASGEGTAASEPTDAEAMVAGNADARAELMAAIASLPADVRDEPCSGDWSVGDILAHLAGAQDGYAEALEHIAAGEPPVIADYGEPGPPDDWNRRTIVARRDRDWTRLIADLDAARSRHEAAVRAVPSATYSAAQEGFPGPFTQARNVAEHYAISARHERGHISDIVAWRRKSAH
jgi:uncharacterized damage-inducible protein DinB